MSAVTTHVLDTAAGQPAAGINVRLESIFAPGVLLGSGVTDVDGRVADLGPETLDEGSYRLVFETAAYFAARGVATFFPSVELVFTISDRDEHYHVPLLLSPFAYSTYRGSGNRAEFRNTMAMAIVLGDNRYGKAESRLVRIYRETPRHEIRDLNVSTALRGDFGAAHLVGDQSQVLPTDTQKQTVYAYAKQKGVGEIEDFALALARHFAADIEPVTEARLSIDEYAWDRITVDGAEHDHSWVRRGQETRTTVVTVGTDGSEHVVSGLQDLVVLKSTGSEFHGFLEDPYTILEPTDDRIMATSLVARWRYRSTDLDWADAYERIRQLLLETFAQVHSLALQQTLFQMGKAVLEAHPDVAEIRFSAPNRHHFVYPLSRFGLDNRNEVFHADDRPYGLIEAQVTRDDAPPAERAWDSVPGFC